MKYSKEEMQAMVYEDSDKLIQVENKISGNSRWSVQYDVVFRDVATGKHYSSSYSKGATESQDERPYEYDGDEIEVTEVEQVAQTVMVWEEVK